MNTEELDKFWSRLSVIQHKNFQRQVGMVWLIYSRGDKQGHERKVNKMLKEVFTRSFYSSCLHNTVAVFPPYPPTLKIKNENVQENFQQLAGRLLVVFSQESN